MKRITSYLLVVLGIITGNHSLAQRTCGTGDYLQMAIQTDPGLLQQTIDARNLADQWLNMHPDASIKKAGTILKIPVVIHVVYNNTNENISDAQAISQIDVLNEDYRKLNSDTGNVPLWFQPIAADVEVEFILAVRDPDGNSTSGITRTSTNSSSFSTNDNVKFSSSGGKDGWPNSDYLNFWVCDLSGGLLGYATPPGFGSSSTDGVVCDYEYVGATPDNPFNSPFNKGRTATHEVGHYLGLAHTFQGGCAGMSASNCSSGGDRICDTPPTSSPNYGCPAASQNSCAESPVNQNDMHMNYMDYVDDGCMNLFTDDQKAVMRSVMNTSRSSLLSSLGGTPVSALDASVELVVPSDTVCGSNQFAPVVSLFNYGSSTITSATITYQVDANPTSTYSWTGNLPTLSSTNVTLPMKSASLGTHTFKAWSSLPNGQTDEWPSNDTLLSSFTFQSGNTISLTLNYDSFQLATLVTWDIKDGSGNVLESGGGYDQNTSTMLSFCLEPGCYVFSLTDNLDYGEGDFSLVDVTGYKIVAKNDIYTYTTTFCVDLPPAGTEEQKHLKDEIMLYPNPSSGLIHIGTGLAADAIQKIMVQNTVGQIVYTDNHPVSAAGHAELNLGFLENGVYFITITTAENSATKKISLIR